MTETSPWSDGAPRAKQSSSPKSISTLLIIVILVVGFGIGVLMTWIVNQATLADKERDRSRAVANLAELSTKIDAAETLARDSKNVEADAQKKMADATRQAEEAARQLVDARKDASSVRSERDEARALATSTRGEIDQARAIDANPAALPTAPLSKSISGVKSVKCTALVIVKTPLPGLADADAKSQLTQSLAGVGLTCAEQSPVEMMLLVSISEDQPRRALGVMLLVTRVMKLPGEAFSKQAAVWGQQRTSLVNDASAATQLNALIQELVAAMNLDLAPPVLTPPIAKPPVATPPVAKPPVATPPIATPPVATPPIATPPVATPPVATPPIATPPVATPPVSPPANGKP